MNWGILGITPSSNAMSAVKRNTRPPFCILDHLLPVGDLAGGEEGVLAGVPAQKVRRVGVPRVSLAAGPHFMEQEGHGAVEGAVQVVGEAAVFFACGAYQGAQFGFEEHVLPVAWSQLHDECYGVF